MSNITTNVTSHFSERHKYTDSQVKLLRSFVLRCEALQFMTHGSYLFYLKWYKLLNIPKNITKFEVIKSKLEFKNKYTKFTAISCPIIPIHLRVI